MKKNILNASYEAPRCVICPEVADVVLCASPDREVEFEEETGDVLW